MKWDTISLGEVIDIKHGYAFDGENFAGAGDHILLTPGNCFPNGGLRLKGDKEKYYVGEFPPEFLLRKGDMLVVMTDLINSAPILGGSFVIPEDNRYLHNQRLGLVRIADEGRIDKGFLYHLLNTHEYRAQVRGSASGATVRHTAPRRIKSCKVKIPCDVAYQRTVARFLASYEELIENNRRRMALLEEAARQLYQEWFVRLRFPRHEHTRIVGGLPSGWVWMAIGELTTKIGSGATPRGGEASYTATGIPLIRSQNVYDDGFREDGLAFIDDEQAAALAHVTVQSRDLLLNITGASVARCCMAPERFVPARVNQHVMIIRVNAELADPFFVHNAINSDENKRKLVSYAQKGSTREALTKEMVANFTIKAPPPTLTRRYGAFAGECFRLRDVLASQNMHLKRARDLLLPRLMSGEIEA